MNASNQSKGATKRLPGVTIFMNKIPGENTGIYLQKGSIKGYLKDPLLSRYPLPTIDKMANFAGSTSKRTLQSDDPFMRKMELRQKVISVPLNSTQKC